MRVEERPLGLKLRSHWWSWTAYWNDSVDTNHICQNWVRPCKCGSPLLTGNSDSQVSRSQSRVSFPLNTSRAFWSRRKGTVGGSPGWSLAEDDWWHACWLQMGVQLRTASLSPYRNAGYQSLPWICQPFLLLGPYTYLPSSHNVLKCPAALLGGSFSVPLIYRLTDFTTSFRMSL